jgi:hypothetical protein
MILYLIKCGSFTKIGVSENVETRRLELQANNPLPCEILLEVETSAARERELYWHTYYKDFRANGEWFQISGDQVIHLIAVESERSKSRMAKMKLCEAQSSTDHGASKLLYSIKESADILSVSPITIRRLIGRGLLTPNRTMRHILIARTELARFASTGLQ